MREITLQDREMRELYELNEEERVSYLEDDTLWIVNESQRIAFETRQYEDWVTPNWIFISHDLSDRHGTSLIELKKNATIVETPERFYSITNNANDTQDN